MFEPDWHGARHWQEVSLDDVLVLLDSAGMLCLSSLAVKLLPFGHVRRLLGRYTQRATEAEQPVAADLTVGDAREVAQIKWGLGVVQKRLPWHCSCLSLAIAGQWMMRRRGLSCRLYVGVDPTITPPRFHAWLQSGNSQVLGEFEPGEMKELFSFVYDSEHMGCG